MASSSNNPLLITFSVHDSGVRQEVRAAQAGQVIWKWKQQLSELPANAMVQKVILSGHSYSRVAIVMITSYLKPLINNMTAVDLNGIVTEEDPESITGLKILCDLFRDCNLVEVNLSSNRLGDGVIQVCDSVLGAQKPSLKHLFLKNMAWSAQGMTRVADFLTRDDGICLCNRLQTLHFHNEPQDEGGAEQFRRILSASTQLNNVRYSGCRALVEGSNALGAGFDEMQDSIGGLQKLSLAGSYFGIGNGIVLFSTALSRCHRLTHLNLRNCGLGMNGTRQVCDALRQAQVQLLELDLSHHKLGPDGVAPVAQLVKANVATLRVFKCQDNKLTSWGVKRLLKEFSSWKQTCALQQLHLGNNECGHLGADALVKATLPNLKLIDLNGNAFSWDDLKRLDGCFGSKLQKMDGNDNLRDVDAEYNLEESSGRDQIDDIISNLSDAIGLALEPCGSMKSTKDE